MACVFQGKAAADEFRLDEISLDESNLNYCCFGAADGMFKFDEQFRLVASLDSRSSLVEIHGPCWLPPVHPLVAAVVAVVAVVAS